MSRRNVAKTAVFSGFCQYFGLHMVFCTVVTLNMTRYHTLTQKSYVKKDLKLENEKNGDGNVFQNLIKTVDNLFGKNSINYFDKSRLRNFVLYKSFFA